MPEKDRSEYRDGFVALVSEALGEPVQPSDHFLDVGGDSLTAAIIVNMLVARDGFVPEIIWFFDAETIAELADRCHAALQEGSVGSHS